MNQFLGCTFSNLPFLVTGIHEGQILLTIIIKSKRTIIGLVTFHGLIPRIVGLDRNYIGRITQFIRGG